MARLPTIFFGHGNPMNALRAQRLHRGLGAHRRGDPAAEGRPLRLRALVRARHVVTAMPRPRTIHDFGGFPRALHEVQYPAPGAPELAARVQDAAGAAARGARRAVGPRPRHVVGAVPRLPGRGRARWCSSSWTRRSPRPSTTRSAAGWPPLRDEGVLVIGSGNLVHNLHAYAWGRHPAEPFDWAVRFETRARELIARGRPRAAGRLRVARPRRAALRPDARALPAAALRARRPPSRGRGPASPWRGSTAARSPCCRPCDPARLDGTGRTLTPPAPCPVIEPRSFPTTMNAAALAPPSIEDAR